MLSVLMAKLTDPQFITVILAGIAAAATVVTIAMPYLENDSLGQRMKAVAVERERIRARERERLTKGQKGSLRQEPTAKLRNLVERYKLSDWLGTETAKQQLVMAGYRTQKAEYLFLVGRLVLPIGAMIVAALYVFLVNDFGQPPLIRIGMIVAATFLGIKMPEIFLKNTISKRQASIRRAWPDSLDLLLICVESGMSIEQAFRRVSQEVGTQSVPLAEELTLTTAELSYLSERRLAYDNLATRIGIDPVRSVSTALIQAERYGTPVGQALRVLAQESRDERMNAAEKKAAALPPKLTVPMILFFLPVLFVVILCPAMIQVFNWK